MKRRLFVTLNRVANAVIARRKPSKFRGGDLLLLTTTGRKTGKRRTTPLLLEHVFDYESYQRAVSRRLAVVALVPEGA